MGNAMLAALFLSGKVAGSWRRDRKKDRVVVTLNQFRPFTASERKAIEQQVARYGNFLGLTAISHFT